MDAVKVTAAAAVLPTKDGRESYHYRGAVLPTDGFTEDGLEHALELGLIAKFEVPETVEPEPVFSQADVDAAVQVAVDAKVAEIEAQKAAEVAASGSTTADKRPAATSKASAAK